MGQPQARVRDFADTVDLPWKVRTTSSRKRRTDTSIPAGRGAARPNAPHCAGIVTSGSASALPVSMKLNTPIRKEKVRFDSRSVRSIQYQ